MLGVGWLTRRLLPVPDEGPSGGAESMIYGCFNGYLMVEFAEG